MQLEISLKASINMEKKKRNLNHRVPIGDYQKVKNDPAMALQLTQVGFGCFFNDIPVLRHTGRDFFSVSSSFQSVEGLVWVSLKANRTLYS